MAQVEFLGETFATSDKIGLMPLMRFAKVAQAGVDSASLEGLAAMYDLIEQCLADEEWDRFVAHASKTRADEDDLLGVVTKVIEVLSARPSSRPSVSSDGPLTVEPRSADDSSSRVIRRHEEQGRPDLALLTQRVVAGRKTA